MQRAIITVGLGFGDEGKGACVDYLCRQFGATLVIRYGGGSQAGHNVQLPDGRRHTFSQFGAGTLAGAATYLAAPMIVHPTAMAREANHLRELGVVDPFATLTLHPRCLVSTAFHQLANQLRELARGSERHGSCGHGIGETRHYWLRHGHDAIFAQDLHDRPVLLDKLELLRQRLWLDLQPVLPPIPAATLAKYDLLNLTAESLTEDLLILGANMHTSDTLPTCTTAVFEGAQGILLDEWFGFHPHTTWSTITPQHALELATRAGAQQICVLGLTRAYSTRHGAGPFPTHDSTLTSAITDPGNPWNPWQGHIRAGWLDLVLLRYAAQACGKLDHLVVSCLDQLPDQSQLCTRYADRTDLPLPVGPILSQQEMWTKTLLSAQPVYEPATSAEILHALADVAPIAITSHGPTHQDRTCQALHFRRRRSEDSPKVP